MELATYPSGAWISVVFLDFGEICASLLQDSVASATCTL
jgi:hypothetical protein